MKEQKIAAKNSEALVLDFELFIENLPDGNDQYHIEHIEGTNSFRVRQDRKPEKKKKTFLEFILNTDEKLRVACQPKKQTLQILKD